MMHVGTVPYSAMMKMYNLLDAVGQRSYCYGEVKTRQSSCMASVHPTFELDMTAASQGRNPSFSVHPTARLHKSRVHLLGRVDSNFASVVRHTMPMGHQLQAVLRHVSLQDTTSKSAFLAFF